MGEELGNYVHQNMGEELGNYIHQNLPPVEFRDRQTDSYGGGARELRSPESLFRDRQTDRQTE